MNYYQQGDVLIKPIVLPSDVKKVSPKDRGYILAEGEATGHAHRIIEIESDIIEMFEKDGQLYVKNKKPVSIVHEEHKTIEIPQGEWKIEIVKEYDHFLEEARNVQD